MCYLFDEIILEITYSDLPTNCNDFFSFLCFFVFFREDSKENLLKKEKKNLTQKVRFFLFFN